jgi:hypothetical protein
MQFTAEEPFGIFHDNYGRVNKFICQVNGGREGGRYNLSVAVLGESFFDTG